MNILIFKFKCHNCESSVVNEETFYSILSPTMKEKVHEAADDPVVIEIIAEFESSCPQCIKAGESKVKIHVIRKQKK